MKKIAFLFGTRPEAIKLSPLIKVFKDSNKFDVQICSTGQHKEMLAKILPLFGLKIDIDLELMTHGQSLASFTSLAVKEIHEYLESIKPDYIVVQGDTSTVFAASLAAFYLKIKVIHIEAGLRTLDKYSPFPEEMNRVLTSKIADFHFAPTSLARENLIKEGIDSSKIFTTGNTGIDSLISISKNLTSFDTPSIIKDLEKNDSFIKGKVVLVTGHRRENFGQGFKNICESIKISARNHPDYLFIYPVHLNPNVTDVVYKELNDEQNILLIPPADYLTFIFLMTNSHIILTDSGGVQEEAPSLNKPIIVMRESTERPEGVDAGCSILVGTDIKKITSSISHLINNPNDYKRMSSVLNPYGDGTASQKIFNTIDSLDE